MEKPFVLPIQTALGKYIYEVNRNEIIAVNDELFDYIKEVLRVDEPETAKGSRAAMTQYAELQDCGYMSPPRVEYIEHPVTDQIKNYLDRGIEKITLQVTQNCNLRCKYCIYSEDSNLNQRSHSTNVMSLETAKRAIDFYRLHSHDVHNMSIGFYGGEPLLAFQLIKEVVEYSEKVFEGKEISFAVTTNGTLLNDDAIRFMLKHNFIITFSIDGPKRIHDKNRIFRDGKGSYDVIMENIQNAYERDPHKLKRSSINMVIDSEQSYDELLTLFEERALKNIGCTYYFVERDGVAQLPSDSFLTKYNYDRFISIFEHFRENVGVCKNKFLIRNIQSFDVDVERFATSRIIRSTAAPSGPCLPGKLRLFVDCFGNFYPCEKVNENTHMKIGSLDEGFDYDRIGSLLNIGRLDSDKCKSCWAISLCNICARAADDGFQLSAQRRNQACVQSRSIAHNKIMEKILSYENQMHLQEISSWERRN